MTLNSVLTVLAVTSCVISILVRIQSEPVSLFAQLNMLALASWVDGKEILDVSHLCCFPRGPQAQLLSLPGSLVLSLLQDILLCSLLLKRQTLSVSGFFFKCFRPLGSCPTVPLAWNRMNHLSFGSWSSPGLLGELCSSPRLKWPSPPSVVSSCFIFCLVIIIVLDLSL